MFPWHTDAIPRSSALAAAQGPREPPARPGPPGEGEAGRPGAGERPAGQRPAPHFPAPAAYTESARCSVRIPAEPRATHPGARESPSRPAPQGWGRGKEQDQEGRRSSLTARSGAQRPLAAQGPAARRCGLEQLPAAAPRPGVAMGPGSPFPREGNGGRGEERPSRQSPGEV